MVQKKAKSKRQTTRHRAKVIRKVAEHTRKQRKAAKMQNKPGRKKAAKDPGVPSGLPESVKSVFLEQMRREHDVERAQKKIRQDAMKQGQNGSSSSVAEDGSKRAYYRELKKVMEAADVLLEVLDARDPAAYRVKEVEDTMLQLGKRVVVILNKTDLVPKPVVEAWVRVIQRQFPCVAFSSVSQHGSRNSGGDELIQLLKNYCRNQNIKTSVSVGVVGYPNVGKSSVINSLKRAKVCRVGATPGVTTVGQEVHLDRNITLIDCPGIVFDSVSSDSSLGSVLLRNCIKVEQMEDPTGPVRAILSKCEPHYMMELYAIPAYASVEEFLLLLGQRLGKLRKGGVVDILAAAKHVIHDWNSGKISYHVEAPKLSDAELTLVPSWAPEFGLAGGDMDDGLQTVYEPAPRDGDHARGNLVIGSSAKKKAEAASGAPAAPAMSTFEQTLNPQDNRARAAALKKSRKQATKAARRAESDMHVDDSASDYDFGAFSALPQ